MQRECLVEPIPEIFIAAERLQSAVDAHLIGDGKRAHELIAAADDPVVRAFTEVAWGPNAKSRYGFIAVEGAPPFLSKVDRPMPRMPVASVRRAAIERDGYHCRFCGMPVIDPAVRKLMQSAYPTAVGWGKTNATQHAAFQCMWLQFDHVLPNSRGGVSSEENIVVTCAPCNFGRMETTLEEARLIDPLSRPNPRKWRGFDSWDGLNRFRCFGETH